MLRVLVAQLMRGLVRRTITLRELDFALCAHTKVGRATTTKLESPTHMKRAQDVLAAAVEQGDAFWGVAGEVFGGR